MTESRRAEMPDSPAGARWKDAAGGTVPPHGGDSPDGAIDADERAVRVETHSADHGAAVCDRCHLPFRKKTPWQHFCGGVCRNAHHNSTRHSEIAGKEAAEVIEVLLALLKAGRQEIQALQSRLPGAGDGAAAPEGELLEAVGEARRRASALLGVADGATEEEILAAFGRKGERVRPGRACDGGVRAALIEARDFLLRSRG